MIQRRLGVTLLAFVAAIGLLGAPVGPTSPLEVRAARPDLTITGDATYTVQPDRQRVRVTVDLTMKNHLKDTTTTRYYFNEAFLDVMPGSSSFTLTRDGTGSPSVAVVKRTSDYTRVRLRYPRLYSGKTAKYRLTFDLKDPGGAATRDVRIGDFLALLPVWAFATEDTPGSSATVVFPAGYDVRVEAGSMPPPVTEDDGRVVLRSGRLDKPLEFFAYLVADRPGVYAEDVVATQVASVPVELLVRSWPDDEPWAERVSGLLRDGLPLLGELIGLNWTHEGRLVVQEAVSRSTGGYAGLFDPRAGRVDIAYYADDFVILHEAAHGWFNGALLADRWVNEAFASWYATQVATDLEVDVRPDVLTDELRAARIPLNAWGPVGSEELAAEDYAYAAAFELARLIAERAGEDGLRRVWSDAAGRIGAYQPLAGKPEMVDGAPDWRGLLDLLEARTDATYDDLWRVWVARPSDLSLLDDRAAARERLAEVSAATRGWRLPRVIREAMRAWRFEDAVALLDGAGASLEQRAAVEAAAQAAGLIVPDTLRSTFEDEDGFDDTLAQAAGELETIERFVEAAALRPTAGSPLLDLGLYGTDPDADLAAARTAYARGDLEASVAASADAGAVWGSAEAVGQGRAISIVLLILAALLGTVLLVAAIRRRAAAVTD
ncbi:MAG: hypothetical protein WEG56_11085 [Chloroflexota bacterium]